MNELLLNLLNQLGGSQSPTSQLPALPFPPVNPSVITPPTFPGQPQTAPLPPSIAQMPTPSVQDEIGSLLNSLRSLGVDPTRPAAQPKAPPLWQRLVQAIPQSLAIAGSSNPSAALSSYLNNLQAQQNYVKEQNQQDEARRTAILQNVYSTAVNRSERAKEKKDTLVQGFEREQRQAQAELERDERQEKVNRLRIEEQRAYQERQALQKQIQEKQEEVERNKQTLLKETTRFQTTLTQTGMPVNQAKPIATALAAGKELTPEQEKVYDEYIGKKIRAQEQLQELHMKRQIQLLNRGDGSVGSGNVRGQITEGQLLNEIQQPYFKTDAGEVYIPSRTELQQGSRSDGSDLGKPLTFQEKVQLIQGQVQQLRGQNQSQQSNIPQTTTPTEVGIDKLKATMEYAKSKGYNEDQTRTVLKANGASDDQINQLFGKSPAKAQERWKPVEQTEEDKKKLEEARKLLNKGTTLKPGTKVKISVRP